MQAQAQTKQATAAVLKRATTFAAIIDPANNASESERATALDKLTKLCTDYGLKLSDYIKPAASPKADATGKREQAKADAQAKRDERTAAQTAHAEKLAKLREQARAFYNQASLVVHMRRAASLDTYTARILVPVQRMRDGVPSDRDNSALAVILANTASDGVTFDPCAIALDVGVTSRLASGGFITTDGRTCKLTPTGRDRAAALVKRAA